MHVSGPAGYAYFAGYPAKDAIFSEEGTASFQHRMKRGYILMVNGKSYSCGSPYAGSNPDCLASLEEHQRLVGKTISVAWFPSTGASIFYEWLDRKRNRGVQIQ